MAWKQNPSIVHRRFEQSWFLVDPHHSLLHELNDVAARIWELCDGLHSEAEIAEQLVSEFEISLVEAADDVRQFIAQLVKLELIERVQESVMDKAR